MTWLRQIPGVREIEFDGETLPRTNDLIIGTGLTASYDPATRKTTLATNASGLPDGDANYQPLTWNGSAWVGAALNLAQAAAVTDILGLANIAQGAAGTVLAGTGASPPAYTASPTVTSLAASTHIALGADPADAGAIRLSHAMGMYGESNTPGTARAVLTWGVAATDTTTLGDSGAATEIVGSSVGINAAAGTMIEAVEVAAGRRVVALALGADLTTTEMPANSGDRVVFLANAATLPTTGDPSGGLVAYGTAGALGLHAAGIKFHERVTAAGITHAARTTDLPAGDFTITVQVPYASATLTNRDARAFVVALSAPAGASTTEGALKITRGGTFQAQIAPYPGSPTTYTGIWLIPATTPTATNYAVLASSTNLLLNAPDAGGGVYLRAAHSNNLLVATTAELTPYAPLISWPNTVTAPTLKQATHATTPQTLTIQAMNVTTGVGSTLALTSGTGSTNDGAVQLQVGTESLVEACEVAAGQRIVALCRGSALTTTQMPSGTGDRVVYVADRATEPTASPVSGLLLYSASSRLMLHAVGLAFHDLAGAISIGIKQAVSDVGTSTIGLFGQDAYASATGTNRNGGTVILQGGTKATGGNAGGVQIKDGDAQKVYEVGANAHGFFGTAPATKQTVTGAKGGNAALASLLTALANYGFLTDSST